MNWPMVPLGEVLTRNEDRITLAADQTYREVTVRLWGNGVTLRRQATGAEIASDSRFVVRRGQFIASRIDARNGAFGLIPAELDGAIVTGDFPTFNVNAERLVPEYLGWYCRTSGFVDLARAASEGTTNRVRLKEEKFLRTAIPLPPVEEQRRIVARVDAIASRATEARRLRDEAAAAHDALRESSVGMILAEADGNLTRLLKTLCSKIGSGSTPSGGRAAYPATGIPFIRSMNVRMRSFLWADIAFISADTHSEMTGTHVKPNDVLLNITGASIGRVACAPTDIAEANVNQHVAIVRPEAELSPRFLMYWLSQPKVQQYINDEQKGATRQGFTKKQIEELEIPVPPLAEQRRIVAHLDALQAKLDAVRAEQQASAAELDALLPSVLNRAFAGQL